MNVIWLVFKMTLDVVPARQKFNNQKEETEIINQTSYR